MCEVAAWELKANRREIAWPLICLSNMFAIEHGARILCIDGRLCRNYGCPPFTDKK